MAFEKEITCPKCKSENVEIVSSVYYSLRSKNLARKFDLFLDKRVGTYTQNMTARQKERLLHRLTPPKEPRKTLPAGRIAFMAFLISYLATSALMLGRLGQKDYFLMTLITAFIVGIPFYLILRLVIRDFHKDIIRYRRLRTVWDKQYFCRDCNEVFIPK
ncbi:MAG: hypothetical protein WC676_02990 [Candidatus Omnitrophota bacterium]